MSEELGDLYDPHIDEDDTLPAISFMTRAELEQWAVLHNWGQTKRDELRAYRVLFHPGSRSHKVLLDNLFLLGS